MRDGFSLMSAEIHIPSHCGRVMWHWTQNYARCGKAERKGKERKVKEWKGKERNGEDSEWEIPYLKGRVAVPHHNPTCVCMGTLILHDRLTPTVFSLLSLFQSFSDRTRSPRLNPHLFRPGAPVPPPGGRHAGPQPARRHVRRSAVPRRAAGGEPSHPRLGRPLGGLSGGNGRPGSQSHRGGLSPRPRVGGV